MGANVHIECPVEGCDYVAGVRLGMGEEDNPAAWSEWRSTLRDEHPQHPENITLVGPAEDAIEKVTIERQSSGELYSQVGRSIPSGGDRTNMWWRRHGGGVFEYIGTASRSLPPEGLPFYQLPNAD